MLKESALKITTSPTGPIDIGLGREGLMYPNVQREVKRLHLIALLKEEAPKIVGNGWGQRILTDTVDTTREDEATWRIGSLGLPLATSSLRAWS